MDAYLGTDYVAEEKQRMEMYKRIASIVTDEERADVTDELIDRYGELPPAAESLLDVSQLRALANRCGVSSVRRGKEGLVMKLDERCLPDPAIFLQAISETDGRLTLTAKPPYRLILKCSIPGDSELLTEGLRMLRKLVKRIDELTEMKTKQADKEPSKGAEP